MTKRVWGRDEQRSQAERKGKDARLYKRNSYFGRTRGGGGEPWFGGGETGRIMLIKKKRQKRKKTLLEGIHRVKER